MTDALNMMLSSENSSSMSQRCEFWLELMRQQKEPRYSTCLEQYESIHHSHIANSNASNKRCLYTQLLDRWEMEGVLAHVLDYAYTMDRICSITGGKSHNEWLSELTLSLPECDGFEKQVQRIAISQASFLHGVVSFKYEQNLIPYGELTDIELAQMFSFTKAVYQDPGILQHWIKQCQYGMIGLGDMYGTIQYWTELFARLPSFVWKVTPYIGSILNESGVNLFPTSDRHSAASSSAVTLPFIFESISFAVILTAVGTTREVHKHPLWQLVALKAIADDNYDAVGFLIAICGLAANSNPTERGSIYSSTRFISGTSVLPNPHSMRLAAAWIIYKAMFGNRESSTTTTSPRIIALMSSRHGLGWVKPTNVRICYSRLTCGEVLSTTQQHSTHCVWCNFSRQHKHQSLLSAAEQNLELPVELTSLIGRTLSFCTSEFHTCSVTATIPFSLLNNTMQGAKSMDVASLVIAYPEWIGCGEKKGQYIFVPVQQLSLFGTCTVHHKYQFTPPLLPSTIGAQPSSSSDIIEAEPEQSSPVPILSYPSIAQVYKSPKMKRRSTVSKGSCLSLMSSINSLNTTLAASNSPMSAAVNLPGTEVKESPLSNTNVDVQYGSGRVKRQAAAVAGKALKAMTKRRLK